MVFLPIIANNLGKIAAAAATTLGIVGFVNRVRAPGQVEHRFRPKVSTDSGPR